MDCLRWLGRTHARYARILNLHRQGFPTTEVCDLESLNREQYYVYLGRSRGMLKECLQGKGISL